MLSKTSGLNPVALSSFGSYTSVKGGHTPRFAPQHDHEGGGFKFLVSCLSSEQGPRAVSSLHAQECRTLNENKTNKQT